MENKKAAKISNLIKYVREYGGRVYVCPAAMAFHNLTKDDLIDNIDGTRGVSTFLVENAKEAMMIYF